MNPAAPQPQGAPAPRGFRPARRGAALLALALTVLAACGKKEGYSKRDLGDGSFEIVNPHGSFKYLSARSAKEAGIGLRIGKADSGAISVNEVFPGSPAQAAGLMIGDNLLSIDGKPLNKLTPEEAAALIKGKPGSPLNLEVQRAGKRTVVALDRATDVMQFTEFPEGTSIQHWKKAELGGGDCPRQKGPSCHFLIESDEVCFFSCPM